MVQLRGYLPTLLYEMMLIRHGSNFFEHRPHHNVIDILVSG